MSPGGGDALQAPECTQTLSHRGAAQPERARHRALCERERKGGREEEEENEVDRVSEEERGKSKRSDMRGKGRRGGFYEGKREEETKCDEFDGWMDGWME